MKVIKGKTKRASKVIVYGQEGVGKTTLVGSIPKVLILDTEDGCGRYDYPHLRCRNWVELQDSLREIGKEVKEKKFEYSAIAIDSIDWAEEALIRHMCQGAGVESIENVAGYGKAYVMLGEQFGEFLAGLNWLIERGVNVIMTGHAQIKKFHDPIHGEYDRHELRLAKHCVNRAKEWCDGLFFLAYRTAIKPKVHEGEKARAVGGKERVIYTSHTAAFDAKNRFGLAEELPASIEALQTIF